MGHQDATGPEVQRPAWRSTTRNETVVEAAFAGKTVPASARSVQLLVAELAQVAVVAVAAVATVVASGGAAVPPLLVGA